MKRYRAARHPAAPEEQMRYATFKLFEQFAADAHAVILAERKKHDRDAVVAILLMLASRLLDSGTLWEVILRSHNYIADSVIAQTGESLGIKKFAPPLGMPAMTLALGTFAALRKYADDAAKKAADLAYEEIPEDEIPGKTKEILHGSIGRAVNSVSIGFALAFGVLVKMAQQSAGVRHYAWVTMHDDRVRPAHRALDGKICSWDDPPLKAEVSSNHEDDHPGDDYNCRCLAAPVR